MKTKSVQKMLQKPILKTGAHSKLMIAAMNIDPLSTSVRSSC